MNEVKTVKCMRYALTLLCAVTLATPCLGYTYASPKPQKQKHTDPWLDDLLKRFPRYVHEIKKVYPDYSGWVIELSNKYGAAPIIAMAGAKKEEQLFGLFREPDMFASLYKALESVVPNERQRAKISLGLLNSMLVGSPEEGFEKALADAIRADRFESLQGTLTRRRVDELLRRGKERFSLIDRIKKQPALYQELLNKLGEEDIAVLQEIMYYPNAAFFLLNTGKAGLGMVKKNPSIVELAAHLTPEDQKQLPEVFRAYPKMEDALKVCGPEAYPTIMLAPDFYFKLADAQSGPTAERYYSAWGVMVSQLLKNPGGVKLCEKLNSYSEAELNSVAGGLASILDLGSSGGDSSQTLAVIGAYKDYNIIPMLARYGDLALRAVIRYGAWCLIGGLIMDEWCGGERDVTAVLKAIERYGDVGFTAAETLKYNRDLHRLVLDRPSDEGVTVLMILFYDQQDPYFNVSGQGKSWDQTVQVALDEYDFAPDTGYPNKKDAGLHLIEFVPGYDTWEAIYRLAKYGETPTMWKTFFAVTDALQVGGVVKALGKSVVKSGVKSALTNAIKSGMQSASSFADDLLEAGGKGARKIMQSMGETVLDMSSQVAAKPKVLLSAMVEAAGSAHDLSKFSKVILNKGKAVINWTLTTFGFTGDMGASEIVKTMALEPVMYHQGANALINTMVMWKKAGVAY